MLNLIRVDIKRLFKDKCFYIGIVGMLVLVYNVSVTNAPVMAQWLAEGEDCHLEDCFFNLSTIIGLFFACVVSLFLGTEHSDGTLRNKLVSGHGRVGVFVSFWFTSFVACAVINTVWLATSLIGLIWLGFGISRDMVLLYFATTYCIAMFYSALYTAICLLTANKATGAVISLLLWFCFLFLGSMLYNELSEPELIYEWLEVDGAYVRCNPSPNPNYIDGIRRQIYEFFSHVIPVCPAMGFDGGCLDKPLTDIIYQTVAAIVTAAVGSCAFRRKDLK